MSSELLLDATGRRRSPAAVPGHNAGHAPRNKGQVYPADPPTVDEIVAVMPPDTGRQARAAAAGADRGAVARRAADPGSAVAARVKSRLATRIDSDPRRQRESPPRRLSWGAGCACWRRISSVMRTRSSSPEKGVPLPVIQRQLGHSYVSTTSVYLQGIDLDEIIGTTYARRAPMMHVSAGPRALRPGPAEQAGGSAARRNRPPGPRSEAAASRDCGSKPSPPAAVGATSPPIRTSDTSASPGDSATSRRKPATAPIRPQREPAPGLSAVLRPDSFAEAVDPSW